jgi:hypothetical protein
MRGPIAPEDSYSRVAEGGAALAPLLHCALREGAKEGLGMCPQASAIFYNKRNKCVAASVTRRDRSLRSLIGIELHVLY